jgi:outer membrane receptor for ferrienterochelin and colicin
LGLEFSRNFVFLFRAIKAIFRRLKLNMKNFVYTGFFILLFSILSAQPKVTFSGYISETGSKELLPFAVVVVNPHKVTANSNTYGFYSITFQASDSVELIFSVFGYKVKKMKLSGRENQQVSIEMEPDNIQLEEVEVNADDKKKISDDTRMSTIDIPIEQVKKIPALLGEKDVLKVIQLMPGVQKGSEGSTGIYVRGGGPDQNLIILDDATVYNVSHLFGFFSLFNGDALKSVELTKGGFPARYGGRLSSVVEMQMKDGSKEKLSGEAGIGLISSRLMLEGPIKKGKSSFLISGRRTYLDLFLLPFQRAKEKFGYFFYDFNAKTSFILNEKDKLYVSGYFGKDKFYGRLKYDNDFSEKYSLQWGNATGTVRWNHQVNQKIFSNTSLIFSDYKFQIKYTYEGSGGDLYKLNYFSGITDVAVKTDYDWFPNSNHHVKMGAQFIYHTFKPSATVVKSSFEGENRETKTFYYVPETAVYIEDDMKLGKKFKVNAGLRLVDFAARGSNYFFPEPRISARYLLGRDLSAKASYSVMNQFIHLLSNTGIGLPTDLWVPSTKLVKPQNSQQIAAGFAKDFTEKGFTVSIEGYYKWSKNIINYKEGASFLSIEDPVEAKPLTWENNVTAGKATSYGAEFFLQRKKGKFTGWIGYTLSWTILQFDSLNGGKEFFARYDRRHDVSVVVSYRIKDNINLSASWVYGTGNAITLPLQSFTSNLPIPAPAQNYYGTNFFPDKATAYTERNAFRMSAYHRMDLAVQFEKKKKKYVRIFELGVYNLYNRKNPFFYYIGNDDANPSKNVLRQVSLFPVIPSVSWTFKF